MPFAITFIIGSHSLCAPTDLRLDSISITKYISPITYKRWSIDKKLSLAILTIPILSRVLCRPRSELVRGMSRLVQFCGPQLDRYLRGLKRVRERMNETNHMTELVVALTSVYSHSSNDYITALLST